MRFLSDSRRSDFRRCVSSYRVFILAIRPSLILDDRRIFASTLREAIRLLNLSSSFSRCSPMIFLRVSASSTLVRYSIFLFSLLKSSLIALLKSANRSSRSSSLLGRIRIIYNIPNIHYQSDSLRVTKSLLYR
jgi:hypothetical protein